MLLAGRAPRRRVPVVTLAKIRRLHGGARRTACGVPEISRFLGIVIAIFYRDHEPSHFHAYYGESKITVGIRDGVVSGAFPRRALRHVLEWRELHEEALLEDWQLANERRPLKRIPPLE